MPILPCSVAATNTTYITKRHRKVFKVNRRYVAFDLETWKVTPEGEDIRNHRPLGISCWAVAWVSAAGGINTVSGCGINMPTPAAMRRADCRELVDRLQRLVMTGHTLLTHNGVGFDFDILAEESGAHSECAELAMNSVDMCLQIHCTKGYPVGLESIAKGLGLQGKTEGMNGALAPQMWAEGKHDEVLAYVAQDVRCTLEVALAVEARGGLSWIAKSGRTNHLAIPRWLTVFEAMQLPEPDTSWMSNPIPRGRFVEWMLPETAN